MPAISVIADIVTVFIFRVMIFAMSGLEIS